MGESGHPTGEEGGTLSPGATAIEGTSCGLGAKLEGTANSAYAEKYRFAPGFSVACGEKIVPGMRQPSVRSTPSLGTPFPGGYRAAEPSRVTRVDIQQYYAVAAISKDISLKVSALARERIVPS